MEGHKTYLHQSFKINKLSEDELVEILTKPKNALVKQFQKLLSLEGVDLSFTEAALQEIAKIAYEKGTGARGLRNILEQLMLDVMYESPSKEGLTEVRVTKSMVHNNLAVASEGSSKRIA